jgi:hypothetical protein
MLYDMPDANQIMQLAPGFRAASKGIEGSFKHSARLVEPGQSFLYSRVPE